MKPTGNAFRRRKINRYRRRLFGWYRAVKAKISIWQIEWKSGIWAK